MTPRAAVAAISARTGMPWLSRLFGDTYVVNEVIVLLAVLQMVTAQMAYPFGAFQVPLEVVLSLALTAGICAKRLTLSEYSLLSLLLLITAVSILQSDPVMFLINAKQNYLGAVALIYFSKITHRSAILLPVFATTSLLIVVNWFVPAVAEFVVAIARDPDFNLSRFGGVFLNAHFNAFFMGAILIALVRGAVGRGAGTILIYMTASKFILTAYLADMAVRVMARFTTPAQRHLMGYSVLVWLPLILVLCFYYSHDIVQSLLDGRNNSAAVILSQLFDVGYYRYLLNLFPSSYFPAESSTAYVFSFHDGQNEIGFFSLAIHSGVLFGAFFLFLLIKRAPDFAVFILVSLMHNQFILYPIMIYIFTQFGAPGRAVVSGDGK